MYSWYRNSQVCYAYLADVKRGENLHEELSKSNWFTRGWTLQELLAPPQLFFDKDGVDIGTRASLEEKISKITGIEDFVNFEGACIAQKMSWASQRETTRVEDMAYCLLGVFNVNMPPLYGEGNKAFTRLQLEIIKASDDESIFAWYDEQETTTGPLLSRPLLLGLLASSPRKFKYSGQIRWLDSSCTLDWVFERGDSPFSMTNKGLHISFNLFPDEFSRDCFIVPLKCQMSSKKGHLQGYPTICVQQKAVRGPERYGRALIRTEGNVSFLMPRDLKPKRFAKDYVQKYIYVEGEDHLFPWLQRRTWMERRSFTLSTSELSDNGFIFQQYWPPQPEYEMWKDSEPAVELGLTLSYDLATVAGVLFVNLETKESIVVIVIVEGGVVPGLALLTLDTDQHLIDLTATTPELKPTRPAQPARLADSSGIRMYRLGQLIKDFQELYSRYRGSRTPLDRISRRLGEGKCVSTSLRIKRKDLGREIGEIKIGLDQSHPRADIQWPPPLWAEKILLSVEEKY